MTFKIKRKKTILDKENLILFGYDVKLDTINGGFTNFDIGNEEELIDSVLEGINDSILNSKDINKRPYYITLSIILFSKLNNLTSIEYITDNYDSIVNREDIVNAYI